MQDSNFYLSTCVVRHAPNYGPCQTFHCVMTECELFWECEFPFAHKSASKFYNVPKVNTGPGQLLRGRRQPFS